MTRYYDIEPGDRTRYVFFITEIYPHNSIVGKLGINANHCIVGQMNLQNKCYTFDRNQVLDPGYYAGKMGINNQWSDAMMAALVTEALGTEVTTKLLHRFCRHLSEKGREEWIKAAKKGVDLVRHTHQSQ